MALTLFLLLTALPIAAGIRFGRSRGALRTLCCLGRHGIALAIAAATATLLWCCGCFWPLGLVTPMAAALVVGLAARLLLGHWLPGPHGPTAHVGLGAVLGGGIGAAVAVLGWMLLPLCCARPLASAHDRPDAAADATPAAAIAAPSAAASLADLATIAHRGLLRHVPVLGDASTEAAALLEVLRATPAQQQRLARDLKIDRLVELPAMQAALADAAVRQDLDALRAGSLLALYRLQRHPRILAVAGCREVAELFGELRPSQMAAAIADPR